MRCRSAFWKCTSAMASSASASCIAITIGGWWKTSRGDSWARSWPICCRQKLPIAHCREYDGFECAIWDAFAKQHDLPLVELLGGAVQAAKFAWGPGRAIARSRISNLWRHGLPTRDTIASSSSAIWMMMWRGGVARLRFTHRAASHSRSERAVGHAGRRAESDREVALDRQRAVRGRPDPAVDACGIRRVEAVFGVPIVLHVSLPYIYHGTTRTRCDSSDCSFQPSMDSISTAGWWAFSNLDRIAAAAGLPCWHGSEIDLGILEAMYLHQCAAAASCTWPSDMFGRLIREHDLLTQPLDLRPPFATIPDRARAGRRTRSRRDPTLSNRYERISRMNDAATIRLANRRRQPPSACRPARASM